MKKKIILSILIILLTGTIFGIIDYNRIKNNKEPLFMIKISIKNNNNQYYIGIGYSMKRNISQTTTEPYYQDNEVKFGLWIYMWELDFKSTIYTINLTNATTCTNTLYYTSSDTFIYLYCLENITLTNKTEEITLKDYLEKENINITNFIDNFNLLTTPTNNSILYNSTKPNPTIIDKTLYILKCNNSIYMSSNKLNNEEIITTLCNNENQTFIRTYMIEEIYTDNKDNEYTYIKISQFQKETNVTVKVNKNLLNNIKTNYYYEFTFTYKTPFTEENPDIKTIFKNATLINIELTDKIGIEQTQDSININ